MIQKDNILRMIEMLGDSQDRVDKMNTLRERVKNK